MPKDRRKSAFKTRKEKMEAEHEERVSIIFEISIFRNKNIKYSIYLQDSSNGLPRN